MPLLAVWLLASVVLAGLVYWGGSSIAPFPKPQKQSFPREPVSPKGIDSTESNHLPLDLNTSSPGRKSDSGPKDPAKSRTPANAQPGPGSQLMVASAARGTENAPPLPWYAPSLTPPVARVAIVIDDFGQNAEVAGKFLTIPIPLTFAVLPYEAHSKEIAELAHSNHHEVLLHIPMEPKGFPKVNAGPGSLLLTMTGDAVRKSFKTAMDFSPYISGVNNHMGSRFTEDSDRMKVVLSEVHYRGLYFLDSYTSPQSVGCSVARELNMPYLRRDVFLDHSRSEAFIRSQLNTLIRKAKVQGAALAIGHPHEITLQVLMQEASRFEKEGIAVVPAKELVQAVWPRLK
ncbi:MAG: divergent polysaccharide deacetylase family protein [Syntrophobacteraceae bacterium]